MTRDDDVFEHSDVVEHSDAIEHSEVVEHWTVVVPVKGFDSAKSRLRRDGTETGALARAFLQDMLAALGAAQRVAQVLVATHDAAVEEVARAAGAVTVDDRGHSGINAAAAHAATRRAPGTGVAVCVSDLPCLTAEAVDVALGLGATHATSFLPDLDGTGTSMWMSPRGAGLPSHFGVDSCQAHARAGAVNLVDAHPDAAEALRAARLDVDTDVALNAAFAAGVGPATAALLDD